MASYLVYVLNHHRQAAIAGAANKLAKMRTADDLPLLYAATDALLDAGQLAKQPICGRLSAILAPTESRIRISRSRESGHGFDWMLYRKRRE